MLIFFNSRRVKWLVNLLITLHNSVAVLNHVACNLWMKWKLNRVSDSTRTSSIYIPRSCIPSRFVSGIAGYAYSTYKFIGANQYLSSRINASWKVYMARVSHLWTDTTRSPVYVPVIRISVWNKYEQLRLNPGKKCKESWKVSSDLYGRCKYRLHVYNK